MTERRTRTPAEKAAEALDTHERKIKRVEQAIAHQRDLLAEYELSRAALDSRHRHLLSDPDLPVDRKQQGEQLRQVWLDQQPRTTGEVVAGD